VAHDTIADIVEAGAELLVAGNAVFGEGNPERDARALLEAARKAEKSSKSHPSRKGEKSGAPRRGR